MLEKGNRGAELGKVTKQGENEEAPDAVSSLVCPLSGRCPRTLTISRYLGTYLGTQVGRGPRYLGTHVIL